MRFLLALLLAAAASAESIEFTVLTEGTLQDRLRLAHPKNKERYQRLKTLFSDDGCNATSLEEQHVKGSKEPNLICAAPGASESARKIIVGAHFDCVGGDGVIDNWSGAVLLPSLSSFLRSKPRRHTFEFIGFAAEEKGLLGSRTYLKNIPTEQRNQIAAVITIDSIGLTPVKIWPNGSSRELSLAAVTLARP